MVRRGRPSRDPILDALYLLGASGLALALIGRLAGGVLGFVLASLGLLVVLGSAALFALYVRLFGDV